jgi:hypothetical protein
MALINEYQEYLVGGKVGRCAGLIFFPYSCADCLQILEAPNSWVCGGLYADCVTRVCVCVAYVKVFVHV